MDIVQISNLFNAICLDNPKVKYYHYGWTSDTNITVPNNFTTDNNSSGKKYPSVHFDFPSETVSITTQDVKSSLNGALIFADTQYYESEKGGNDSRSIIEVQRDLKNLAVEVISEFNRLGRTFSGRNIVGILQDSIRITYSANRRADRLVELFVEFTLIYRDICSSFVTDIPALPPDFNSLPPSTNDYELIKT